MLKERKKGKLKINDTIILHYRRITRVRTEISSFKYYHNKSVFIPFIKIFYITYLYYISSMLYNNKICIWIYRIVARQFPVETDRMPPNVFRRDAFSHI